MKHPLDPGRFRVGEGWRTTRSLPERGRIGILQRGPQLRAVRQLLAKP